MLNDKQLEIFEILKTGENAFITGDAGTGKSYLLREFIEYCKKFGKNVVLCASSGIAAVQIGGVTVHRAFEIKPEPVIPETGKMPRIMKAADVIIIDEISMLRIDLFDRVINTIRKAEKLYHKNIQLIVTGDFNQLPPVITTNDATFLKSRYSLDVINNGAFAFMSPKWEECSFKTLILDEIIRQQDKLFIEALNGIRRGDYDAIKWINENALKKPIPGAITLYATNKRANEKNEQELASIKSVDKTYIGITTGRFSDNEKVVPDRLNLKTGARVMSVVNDVYNQKPHYNNGSLGTVIRLGDYSVLVQFDNGHLEDISYNVWESQTYNVITKINPQTMKEEKELSLDIVGTYRQIPLKLAYSITIHKSQGQTYDAVNLEPYCFAPGQLYVALSRVKSIDKLCLLSPIQNSYLITNPKVKEFYE